jgi:hypothetical protein
MPPNRLTLLTGIFALGSYFLCVLSGIAGWFRVYFAYTTLVIALCFFAWVACSSVAQFLLQHNSQGRLTRISSRKTKLLTIFPVLTLILAHIFILKYNVSPSENLLGNHDQGMYVAAASNLKTSGSHAMALPIGSASCLSSTTVS